MLVRSLLALMMFVVTSAWPATEDVISITIDSASKKNKKNNQLPLYIGVLQDSFAHLTPLLEVLKHDLERSGQFKVTIEPKNPPTTKAEIAELAKSGFNLAFFINGSPDHTCLEWRLYEAAEAQMVKGKKTTYPGGRDSSIAHMIARDMWIELMGNEGPFSTKLCYIKRIPKGRRRSISQICVCDYDGTNEQVLKQSATICVAPCWGLDPDNPFIIYSEFTQSNVRLVSIDLRGRRHVALDFDGTLAGVSFSHNKNRDIVYGRSGGIWHYSYDPSINKGTHILLIREKEAAACPILLNNGDVIYCSQGKIKKYNPGAKTKEVITLEGYCVGPAYCEKTDKLVFSRRIKGTMQLFMGDLASRRFEQITFDKGDKADPYWSPCGSWLTYCLETGNKGRIYSLNPKTGKLYPISSPDASCRSSSWSPVYQLLPEVKIHG